MTTAETLDLDHGPGAGLEQRVQRLTQELETERAELDRLAQALADAHRVQAVLERDKAVAEGEVAVAQRQLEQERLERSLLTARMATLLSERDLALASMGWWSGRRYRRRTAAKNAHPTADQK